MRTPSSLSLSTPEHPWFPPLLEVGQVLANTPDLRAGLHRALEVLERHHHVERGAIFLVHRESGEVQTEATLGLPTQGHKVRFKLGEGITGRVVQTGKPVVVPRISKEPLFLHWSIPKRITSRREFSFICVPILIQKKALGALALELEFDKARDFEAWLKPLRVVAVMVAQALKARELIEADRQRLADENSHLRAELKERYDFSNIVGTSGPMRQVYEQITQVARSNATVLIRGESGTGKELIAHAIHYSSLRANKPFVKVSCAALPETLIESELFGYERGAFTGAQMRKKGRFELAEGGTLFLDEIGELNLSTQIKLLRVLQQREFERVGGTETVRVNVRLIAATHKKLEDAITDRSFREDLFYRLNVFTLFVPPLRERKSDILLLAEHFLTKYGRENGRNIRRISTPAIDMLMSYHWPGNVRELENTIERAVVVCDGNVIHGHHLPPSLQTAEASGTTMARSLTEAVGGFERDLIVDALKTSRGNCAKAARMLGTTERIIHYKVRKYAIPSRRFRS